MGLIDYLFSHDMETKESILGVEKSDSKLPVGPCLHCLIYRVKEGSLLFVDELHQDSWLVVGDVSHVIPPVQKKSHSVCPKTFQTFMTVQEGHLLLLSLTLQMMV